jgi:hypothetical protein
MDLLDRYLLNVRAYLPGGDVDDVIAELRENIRSQVEDREERLGRPLTEEEQVAILRAHGHPLIVAGAYRSDGHRLVLGREVIGPALFPFYRLSLAGIVAITALVVAFGAVASLVGVGHPLPGTRTALFNVVVLVLVSTALFAGLQFWFRRTAQTWDPRELPTPTSTPVTPTSRRVGAAFQIVGTLFFLWLWVTLAGSTIRSGGAFQDLRLGTAWRAVYVGVTASTALSLVTPVLILIQPSWHRYRWLVSLFSSGAFIAFASISLWNGSWFVPATTADLLEVERVCQRLNRGIAFGLGFTVFFTAIVTVFEVIRGAWREFRRAGTA